MDKDMERLGKERLKRVRRRRQLATFIISMAVIVLGITAYRLIQPASAADQNQKDFTIDNVTENYVNLQKLQSNGSYTKMSSEGKPVDWNGEKEQFQYRYIKNEDGTYAILIKFVDGYIEGNSSDIKGWAKAGAANTAGAANAAGNAAGAANNGAEDGANAANTIVPDGQNDPQDGIQAPQAQPNTDIADEQVPQAANDNKHDIADEQVPLATMISESGMVVPLAIGALGIVAILAIMIFVIVKNVKSVRVQKNSMKHKGKDNKN